MLWLVSILYPHFQQFDKQNETQNETQIETQNSMCCFHHAVS